MNEVGKTLPLALESDADIKPYCTQFEPERMYNPPPESPLLGVPPLPPAQNVLDDANIAINPCVV